MDTIYETALNLKSEKGSAKKEIHDKLNFTEQQVHLITQEMKKKIHSMVEDVEQRVKTNKKIPNTLLTNKKKFVGFQSPKRRNPSPKCPS